MTSERAKEIIKRYYDKHGEQTHDFIIVANDKDGIYRHFQLLDIIAKEEEVVQKLRDKSEDSKE